MKTVSCAVEAVRTACVACVSKLHKLLLQLHALSTLEQTMCWTLKYWL